jgi:hypothetical protein
MMRRTCLLLVLLILSSAAEAAEATSQVVVIKSNAAAFAPGKIIEATETLSLSAGERMTAVAANGLIIHLVGPYAGTVKAPPVAEKSSSIVQTISNLMKSNPADRNTLAVTRQWQVERPSPDPWAVDIATQGPHCVLEKRPVSIWRNNAATETPITLRRSSGGRAADGRWRKGENAVPWPPGVEIVSGQTYRAKIGESREDVIFDIFVAPRDLPTTAHRVAWIAEHGCRRQAQMLLEKAASE